MRDSTVQGAIRFHFMSCLYLSVPHLVCFEGEAEDVAFTPAMQAKVNSLLAEQKRAHQARLSKVESQLAESEQSKTAAESEAQALQGLLESTQQRAENSDARLKESTIRSALVDAAATHGAYSNSILISVLQGDTSVADDGKVVVSIKAKDDEGKDTMLQMSPADAVKWMKDRPETYGGLFADYVAQGGTPQPGANGRVDVRSLSVAQIKKLYAENPKALGL